MSENNKFPNDIELWKQVTEGLTKLKKNIAETDATIVRDERPVRKKSNHLINSIPISVKKNDKKDLELGALKDISLKQAQKMDKGNLEIEATLDLHGKTLDQSHSELKRFIVHCYSNKIRCVLVITGKGLKSEGGEGRIKKSLLSWINDSELKNYILRVSQANRKHGGSGAFYILLKRER